MINVLFVCCIFTWGGIEKFILNTIDNIDTNAFSITVLLPVEKSCEREFDLINRNIRVLKYQTKDVFTKVNSFNKILLNNSFDIIHFHTAHESALLALCCYRMRQKRIIVHAHSSESGDKNKNRIHLAIKRIEYYLCSKIFKKCCCISCEKDASDFMFGKNNPHIHYLYYGVDLDSFSNNDEAAYDLCVNARFDYPKNPFFIVDVINELVKKDPNIIVHWIGNGPLLCSIKEKIASYGITNNILLLGVTNDVPSFFSQHKYLLLPSLNEGLPLVLTEAQASGLKCFVSAAISNEADCGGLVYISLDKKANEWASIIYQEIKQGNPIEIDQKKLLRFDLKKTTKDLEKIYYSVVKER